MTREEIIARLRKNEAALCARGRLRLVRVSMMKENGTAENTEHAERRWPDPVIRAADSHLDPHDLRGPRVLWLHFLRCLSLRGFGQVCYKYAMTREEIIARLRENEAALRARGVTHAGSHSGVRTTAGADALAPGN